MRATEEIATNKCFKNLDNTTEQYRIHSELQKDKWQIHNRRWAKRIAKNEEVVKVRTEECRIAQNMMKLGLEYKPDSEKQEKPTANTLTGSRRNYLVEDDQEVLARKKDSDDQLNKKFGYIVMVPKNPPRHKPIPLPKAPKRRTAETPKPA